MPESGSGCRPGGTAAPFDVWKDSFTEPLVDRYGLQPGWFDLLATLRRAGAPYELNPTQLMQATMLSSGGMTKRLDRMAEAGLVERRADPTDRRGTLVRLTRRGRSTIDRLEKNSAGGESLAARPGWAWMGRRPPAEGG